MEANYEKSETEWGFSAFNNADGLYSFNYFVEYEYATNILWY
ncbi:hypothetical protein MUY_002876 [Bacillus licheniformis WX-02]|nr:hypothetical protein MUY_002876 [Bacillus licheniformis WX-02]